MESVLRCTVRKAEVVPVPMRLVIMPVSTSNSVLAVPAPVLDTIRWPERVLSASRL